MSMLELGRAPPHGDRSGFRANNEWSSFAVGSPSGGRLPHCSANFLAPPWTASRCCLLDKLVI